MSDGELPIVAASSPFVGDPALTVTVDVAGNFEVRGTNRLSIPTLLRLLADEVQERNRDPR